MRVIVTGGAGFIGSHLVERLVKEGNEVIVIDNLSTGRESNLDKVKDKIIFYKKGVHELTEKEEIFEEVEWVFHLAGLADIVPSIEYPLKYHQSNVDGTIKVLEASRNAGVKKIIYAASSSCYGIPDIYPTPETAPIKPMYPYALTKYIGEEYILHWGKVYKLPVVSCRLFNVYGPRSRTTGAYGAVFGVFLAQKLAGKPFTVVGDGTQKRDFIFVSDVVEAFLTVAMCDDCVGEVFNVGSGEPQSINRFVELLEGDVVYVPKRPGEPDVTWADISKIQKFTGWSPKVSFEEGVSIVLDHIEDWRDAPVWDEKSIKKATEKWFKYLGQDCYE